MSFFQTHPFREAFLAIALEALAARIMEQGEIMLQRSGVEFPARACSTVLLLGEQGEMSAADVAKALQHPHQLVTQRVELLIDLGIVARIDDRRDARRKVLRLTRRGQRQFELLNQKLAEAQAAFRGLFREIGCDLFIQAEQAAEALNQRPLLARMQLADATA